MSRSNTKPVLTDDKQAKKPAWVEFEPEFNKSVPSLRLWSFVRYLGKKVRETNKARREREQGLAAPDSTGKNRTEAGSGTGK